MIYLTRVEQFCAAHRLHSPALSEAENKRIYEKCNWEGGHGHNYQVKVTVSGEPNPTTGMLISITDLKNCIWDVLRLVDHRNLDRDVNYFTNNPSTAENIAIWMWKQMVNQIPSPAQLYEIKLYETDKNIVVYRGE